MELVHLVGFTIGTSSFLTRSAQLIFSVLLQSHVLSLQLFLIHCPKCPIPYPIQNNIKQLLLSHRDVSVHKDDLHQGYVFVRVLIEVNWGFVKKSFELARLLGCRCGICNV
jgi:hypothetical protein